MYNSFLITEDNLMGNIASSILQLKRAKVGQGQKKDMSNFIQIIEFLNKAHTTEYKDLLYDKNFIVSEKVLSDLHAELIQNNKFEEINLPSLVKILSSISDGSGADEIDIAMEKLKEIAKALLKMKSHKQRYM